MKQIVPKFMPAIGIFTVNKGRVYQCASPNQFDWFRRHGWLVLHLDCKTTPEGNPQ